MSTVISIHNILLWAKERLDQASIERGWHEARLLLADILDVKIDCIIAYPETVVSSEKAEIFYRHIQRRIRHEPVSRILGQREFWSLPFRISPATLDPRPESETLIEAILKDYPNHEAPLRILDLGTGSGCLLLTLLKEYPQAFGVGADKSPEALLTARKNADNLQVQDRARFIEGDWAENLHKVFDVIVSNPPYIPGSEIPFLPPEVRLYDPLDALDGGEGGVECYRTLAPQFSALSHKKTRIYLEIGQGQEEKVEKIMNEAGYSCLAWHRDLAGIKRCGVFLASRLRC